MKITFPDKLKLANLPAPLVPLPRISKHLGGPKLWVKRDDLTEFAAGGNKIRKLEYVLADALSQKADWLITCGGIQSNHCRATAILAGRLGLGCQLILRGVRPTELSANTFLGHLSGADLSFYGAADYANLDRLFRLHIARLESQGHRPYRIPTGASDEVGIWGYIDAGVELAKDIKAANLERCLVCCATGSGGTHAGLALAHELFGGAPVRAYAVCDDANYFANKVKADISRWHKRYCATSELPEPILDICDDFIGRGYAQADSQLLATISWAAKTEGLILDPVYTGKAFLGVITQIRSGQLREYENIIFVHTGGGFGLFPYQSAFAASGAQAEPYI